MAWRVSGLGVRMPDIDDSATAQNGLAGKLGEGCSASATRIIVCSSCRDEANSDGHPRPGLLLGDKVRQAVGNGNLEVEQVECLANCKRRLSVAMVKPGGWTYVFGGLSLDDADDLVEGARLYRDAESGLIPWRGRPDCLKRGLVARIPPQNFDGKAK